MNTVAGEVNVDWSLEDRKAFYRRGLGIRALSAAAFLSFFAGVLAVGFHHAFAGFWAVIAILAVLICINPVLWWVGIKRSFVLSDFYAHWCGDVLGVTGIVYNLGTLDVPMAAAAYIIMIVSSATFANISVSILLAAASSVSYAGLWLLETAAIIPHKHVAFASHLDAGGQTFFVSGVVVLFFVFAYLAGSLAEELRTKTLEIASQKERAQNSFAKERHAREGMALLSSLVQHDVYSPLGVVSAACDEAMKTWRRGDYDDTVRYLTMIKDRLLSIESAIRTLGLFQEEYNDQQPTVIDTRSIAEQLLEDLAAEIAERKIRVHVKGEWGVVRVPEMKLYHVLRNLLSNAIKCVAEDGSGEITIEGRRTGEGSLISVVDNGPGVPPEVKARLQRRMTPPGRLHGAGFGAGLALCRNLAAGWGGSMSVRDRDGGGSVFEVTVPHLT
jgi:signal transduction histidine kinase